MNNILYNTKYTQIHCNNFNIFLLKIYTTIESAQLNAVLPADAHTFGVNIRIRISLFQKIIENEVSAFLASLSLSLFYTISPPVALIFDVLFHVPLQSIHLRRYVNVPFLLILLLPFSYVWVFRIRMQTILNCSNVIILNVAKNIKILRIYWNFVRNVL